MAARLKLPRLVAAQHIVDKNGAPNVQFQQFWQQAMKQIESSINGIQAALDAADAANAAAVAANTAAGNAQDAADTTTRDQALINSYISPDSVLTSTTTTITVASHTRYYADGTTASVTGGTVAVTATGDTDYVYYNDTTRTGGAVTFQVALTQPPQTGDTHVVGAVLVPVTGTANGGAGPKKPGYVDDEPV